MSQKCLEVGTNEQHEVVINLPPGEVGHIVFSVAQARSLADTLRKQASIAESLGRGTIVPPPVDRNARVMHDGSPEQPDHREIDPVTGMQKGYVVLSAEERARGFVRPVRQSYVHKTCGSTTTMGRPIAETYARDPKFYSGTFCSHCRAHYDLDQFVWAGTDVQVGS